jgi:hypothetical protein
VRPKTIPIMAAFLFLAAVIAAAQEVGLVVCGCVVRDRRLRRLG